MTIASLIVDVAANTVKLQKDVEKIHGSLGSITKMAGTVGKALAGAFTVAAVAGAVMQVTDYAGRVSDLSERLKISTRTVQQWEAAFAPASVSIDTVAKASEQLSDKLVSGDKSAVGALKLMGLSTEALLRMKPEDRFVAVADSVGRLQDSAERVYASKALFGKAGPELLAALNGRLGETITGLDDMGVILDDDVIKAADEFGDQLGVMGKQLLAILATVVGPILPALTMLGNLLMWIGRNVIGPVLNVAVKGALTILYTFWSGLTDVIASIVELGAKLPGVGSYFQQFAGALRASSEKASAMMANLWTTTESVGTAAEATAPKLLGLGRTMSEEEKKTAKLNATLKLHTTTLTASTFGHRQFTDALLHEDPAIRALDVRLAKLTTTIEPLYTLLPGVTHELNDWRAAHKAAAEAIARVNSQLTMMPKRVKTAVEAMRDGDGGGGFVGGLTKHFKDGLSDLFGGADSFKSGAKNLIGKIGTGIFEGLGNVISGGVASLISKGIGLVGKGIGAIWGKLTGGEGRKVNDMRDELQATFGTFDQMAAAAQRAGYPIERLLDTKKVKDFQREMAALLGAIEAQDQAMQFLQATLEKYNFTAEEAGGAVARMKLDEQAQVLFKEFEALKAAGIDVDTIINKMGASITEFVQQSIATGTEIPAAMAPMIQRMIEMGRLTDKNGVIITDLEEAGIQFAMTMSEGFQALIAEVRQLTDAIARGLGGAIRSIPPVHVPVHTDVTDRTEFMPMLGRGGIVRRPTIALIGERGPEAVVPLNSYNGGRGDLYLEVVTTVDGQEISRKTQRYTDRELRRRRKLAAA